MPLPQYIIRSLRDHDRAINAKNTDLKTPPAEIVKPGSKTNERPTTSHHINIEEENLSSAEDEGFSTSPFNYLTNETPFVNIKDEEPVLLSFDYFAEAFPCVSNEADNSSLLPLDYQAKDDPFLSSKNQHSSPYVFKHQTREVPVRTKNKPISRFLFTYEPEEAPLPPTKATEGKWRTALEINVPMALTDREIAAFQEYVYPLAPPGFEIQLLVAKHGDTRVIKVQVLNDAVDEQVDLLKMRIQHLVSSAGWGGENENEKANGVKEEKDRYKKKVESESEKIENQKESIDTTNQETTNLTELDHWNQSEHWDDVDADEWIKTEEWLDEADRKQLQREIEAVAKIEESIYARLRKSRNYKACKDLVEKNWDSLRDYHHLMWYCSVWANWMDRAGDESVPELAAGKVDRRRGR